MMSIKRIILPLIFTIFLTLNAAASSNALEAARLYEAEANLSALGYWVLNIDGAPDESTRHAITAFQKVEGLKRTGLLTDDVLDALRFAARPAAKFDTGAAHVEVDIGRQVLFLTDAVGNVVRILAVSTGSEKKYLDEGKWQTAHTPRGAFRVQWQFDGVRLASLGALYNPSYFDGGIAIHGSNSIPVYPDSHGCVRIPRYADEAIRKTIGVGTGVFVYDDHFLTHEPARKIAPTSWFTPRAGIFGAAFINSYASLTLPNSFNVGAFLPLLDQPGLYAAVGRSHLFSISRSNS
jgi:hypothetical protein